MKVVYEMPSIRKSNAIQTNWEKSLQKDETFDCIIGNQPFFFSKMINLRNLKTKKQRIQQFPLSDRQPSKRWRQRPRPSSTCVRYGQSTGKTLAHLYGPDKMPSDLPTDHHALDRAVDGCYGVKKGFGSEGERVGGLFGRWGEVKIKSNYLNYQS